MQRNFERPSPGMLNSDPAVLEAELVRTFGATTVLPTRAQLREANRCAQLCRSLGWLFACLQMQADSNKLQLAGHEQLELKSAFRHEADGSTRVPSSC